MPMTDDFAQTAHDLGQVIGMLHKMNLNLLAQAVLRASIEAGYYIVKPTSAGKVDARLTDDGLYAVTFTKGSPYEQAATVLVVREGELLGMRGVPIDDVDALKAILAHPEVTLARLHIPGEDE